MIINELWLTQVTRTKAQVGLKKPSIDPLPTIVPVPVPIPVPVPSSVPAEEGTTVSENAAIGETTNVSIVKVRQQQ